MYIYFTKYHVFSVEIVGIWVREGVVYRRVGPIIKICYLVKTQHFSIWFHQQTLSFINVILLCVRFQYLDFDNLPDTNFSCDGKVIGGYYADVETGCQMFHVCTIGQKGKREI